MGSTVSGTAETRELQQRIRALCAAKNAVILAHYYQEPEIQEVADYIGDSLGLSQQAAKTEADVIVFAGVHFMAETAKILNPTKKVLLPDLEAGCSLATSCPPDAFGAFIHQHNATGKRHTVVSYINCSAEVKALSDVICTSANAVDVINSIPESQPIIFGPDRNLGRYVARQTGRELIVWDGACIVHEAFSFDKLVALVRLYPQAVIIAHPESEQHILDLARFVGSTTAMIEFVKTHPAREFIVATEAGILHQMRIEAPEKILIAAPAEAENTCACSECPYMKLNTLEKLYQCLHNELPEVLVDEPLRHRALQPIQRMLDISASRQLRTLTPA